MKYKVSSSAGCNIGPGQRLRLTAAQIATRTHAVTIVDEEKGEVEPHMSLAFKAGEVIDLPQKWDELDSYFRSVLEPTRGDKPDREKAPTSTSRKAAKPAKVAGGNDGGAGAAGGVAS